MQNVCVKWSLISVDKIANNAPVPNIPNQCPEHTETYQVLKDPAYQMLKMRPARHGQFSGTQLDVPRAMTISPAANTEFERICASYTTKGIQNRELNILDCNTTQNTIVC
jgi:hypothetical protein